MPLTWSDNLRCHSTSTLDMDCSHMLNAEISMASTLWSSFHHWQRSVSLEESCTRMEEFTSTCLSTSDGGFDLESQAYLMWEASTQTLVLLREHLTRDTNTRLRMETLSAEASPSRTASRAEAEIARLIRSGLKLRVQKVERSFGAFSTNWIRNRLRATSILCRSTPSGNLQRCLPCMSHHQALASSMEKLTGEMIGYRSLVLDLESHS